ncbi:hypothetical protein F0562_021150 [Nyssa sinensis]|uniref:BHLH domain-containing protein n=1 Tax=Nyssa sinensis TaxID=561372 RepID=A0A5J5BJQ5_9ASTE|nr:hypothetical protein F0562_021150 [Nyssa sinensis]
MGTQLHQALRTLCLKTEWKYAVFWKLKHQARMMLTWEDAYYDNHEQHDPSENECFGEIVGNLHNGHYSHDRLGLAVAKMSYHVYSLGEGIVGQVAVTGKHLWIFSDKHAFDSCSSFEYRDGWHTQFSAGIRTVVVVAVVPHGVLQLGSLNKITEDLKLVNHIRDIFFAFPDFSVGHIPSVIQHSMKSSSCLSDISTRSSGSGNFNDCIRNLDRIVEEDRTNIWSPMFPSLGKPGDCSYIVPLPDVYPQKTVETVNKHEGLDTSMPGGCESANLLKSTSEIFLVEQRKRVHTKLLIDSKVEGESSGFGDLEVGLEDIDTSLSHNYLNNKSDFYDVTLPADKSGVDISYFPPDLLDSAARDNQNGVLCLPEPFDMRNPTDFEKNFNPLDKLNTSLKFSAGCELYEALGPAFQKQNNFCDWETEKTETETSTAMTGGVHSSSLLTTDSGVENLLEAVVANVCRSGIDDKSEKSFSKSVQSLLTTEKLLEPTCDKHIIGSAGSSFCPSLVEEDTLHCLNSSKACRVRSSKGSSSMSRSTCSEQLERPQEPAKINKKRARPGENCRPRPRDRQLIQDRIKELRELVPNGSKCSIDSLLERTIKHMLFLQSITKHADKLNKFAESKFRDKERGIRRLSGYEQGSSWAVEVGSHLKIFPIMVENINKDGQMVVEMMCEECSHFLEIAEAIRSLGLTILKGVTEAYGDKTWICFVVEGQKSRNMHRMDILCSLVQILQPKTTI